MGLCGGWKEKEQQQIWLMLCACMYARWQFSDTVAVVCFLGVSGGNLDSRQAVRLATLVHLSGQCAECLLAPSHYSRVRISRSAHWIAVRGKAEQPIKRELSTLHVDSPKATLCQKQCGGISASAPTSNDT